MEHTYPQSNPKDLPQFLILPSLLRGEPTIRCQQLLKLCTSTRASASGSRCSSDSPRRRTWGRGALKRRSGSSLGLCRGVGGEKSGFRTILRDGGGLRSYFGRRVGKRWGRFCRWSLLLLRLEPG